MPLAPEILGIPGAHGMSSEVMACSCAGPFRPFPALLPTGKGRCPMWFLVATMLVMGHHYKIHVETFTTHTACENRKADVLETAKTYGALIVVTCETDA